MNVPGRMILISGFSLMTSIDSALVIWDECEWRHPQGLSEPARAIVAYAVKRQEFWLFRQIEPNWPE